MFDQIYMYLKQFVANGGTLIVLNGNPASQICRDGPILLLSQLVMTFEEHIQQGL